MNYSPKNFYVWDAWCMVKEDEVHLYHLQAKRSGADVPDDAAAVLGHAVSRDLIHWEEREPCFGPDETNPLDNAQPWTGCALWHENQAYLYYTMRGHRADGKNIQHIGLATSPDGNIWTRNANNPIITPDARWYSTIEAPTPGVLDCRDLVVVHDPQGGWLGFYATRIPSEEVPQTSAVACVHSDDLIHWKHRPPAFVPGNYACIEVPDVFELNGLWYMTCLTGNFYGNRGYWRDANLVNGTMYAVSENPEGPYHELKDNALIGSRTTGHISCRSVMWEGERHVLYTDRERHGHNDDGAMTMGTLSTPKVLRTDGERLYAAYSPRIESCVTEELIGPSTPPRRANDAAWGQIWTQISHEKFWTRESNGTIRGEMQSGWSVELFDAQAESFIFEATIKFDAVAAGLALRVDSHMSGAIVAVEADAQVVSYYEAPAFDWSEKRSTPLARNTPIFLRVVNRLEHVEVYINDDLRLQFSRYRGLGENTGGGQVGLFVDRGKAHFSDVRLRALNVTRPDESA